MDTAALRGSLPVQAFSSRTSKYNGTIIMLPVVVNDIIWQLWLLIYDGTRLPGVDHGTSPPSTYSTRTSLAVHDYNCAAVV